MSSTEMLAVVAEPLSIHKFKCHTQMVETAVQEVTKASHKVVGTRICDATVKTSMENRV